MSRESARAKGHKAALVLTLKRVRCFRKSTRIPIRPLTILVGENSSGKSTVLAMLSTMLSNQFPYRSSFADAPYRLGGFESIATVGKSRSRSFEISFSMPMPRIGGYEFTAAFRNLDGEAVLSGISMVWGKDRVDAELHEEKGKYWARTWRQGKWVGKSPRPATIKPKWGGWEQAIAEASYRYKAPMLMPPFTFALGVSMAPIRTAPKRMYEVWEWSPEGSHIPFALAHALVKDKGSSPGGLRQVLADFGSNSGLFEKVLPMWVDRRSAELVRLFVALGGRARNLPDVGYGVSQGLPIVVQTWITRESGWLLVQQPEIHLHPRAQAALGTMFAYAVGKYGRQVVVETHSDFIVNRVRQEIARKTISAGDVQLLYFERRNGEAKVYPIGLDRLGSITEAPPGYRNFFLEEERSLLQRGRAQPCV
jgi:energy-coupling factor transporter ATP-binding protein EcfA2